jgi:hypothetical protein
VQMDKDTSSTVQQKNFVDVAILLMQAPICKSQQKDQTSTNFQLTMVFSVSLLTITQSKKESV